MKTELLRQLQSYSALVAGLIAADAANGQIVYTDLDPDEDVHGNYDAVDWRDDTAWKEHQIDLDDDGNADYTLRIRSDQGHGAGFLKPTEGNFYVNNPDGNPFAAPLDKGTQIGEDDTQVWTGLLVYPNGYNYLGTLTTFGKSLQEGGGGFTGQTDKYVGLKFMIGSNSHYGWARLDVRNDSRLYTLKDFAYESTPNKAIEAGAIVSGINQDVSKLAKVYNIENRLNITLNNENDLNSEMTLFDITGRKVLSELLTGLNNELTVNVPTGVYIVNIDLSSGIYTKKIVVK